MWGMFLHVCTWVHDNDTTDRFSKSVCTSDTLLSYRCSCSNDEEYNKILAPNFGNSHYVVVIRELKNNAMNRGQSSTISKFWNQFDFILIYILYYQPQPILQGTLFTASTCFFSSKRYNHDWSRSRSHKIELFSILRYIQMTYGNYHGSSDKENTKA